MAIMNSSYGACLVSKNVYDGKGKIKWGVAGTVLFGCRGDGVAGTVRCRGDGSVDTRKAIPAPI